MILTQQPETPSVAAAPASRERPQPAAAVTAAETPSAIIATATENTSKLEPSQPLRSEVTNTLPDHQAEPVALTLEPVPVIESSLPQFIEPGQPEIIDTSDGAEAGVPAMEAGLSEDVLPVTIELLPDEPQESNVPADEHAPHPALLETEKAWQQHVETLEPQKAKAAEVLLTTLLETAETVRQLLETDEASAEFMETAMEAVCVQLFETLGITYDETEVKRFVRVLLADASGDVAAEARHFREWIEEGTHEQKYTADPISHLLHLIRRSSRPFRSLGNLVIGLMKRSAETAAV